MKDTLKTPAPRFRATPEMQRIAAKKLAEFKDAGIEIKPWARKNGFKIHSVMMVLHGYSNCTRGEVHQVAVALGMKAGTAAKLETFYPRPAAVPRAVRSNKAAAA